MTPAEPALAGRHAVVTGGGRGIGAAIAIELARRGASVTVMGRDVPALEAVAAAIEREHRTPTAAVRCDVADGASIERAFAESAARFPAPHILVNNAGYAEAAPFLETPLDTWERMLAVNVTGPVLCIRAVLPAMLASGAGRIVNVASMAGLKGYTKTTAYSASKHALVGLTRSLALEVRKRGVTVNAVCPGYTDTDMAAIAERNIMKALGKTAAEARAMVIRRMPRGEIIRPVEVAHVVAWLCTPAAGAINGQAIPVAGGEM